MMMGVQPKVSVIIPVYNGEEFISECMDSVINQTLKDIEIFVVDDGSTDRTPSILKRYARRDNRIRIITQKNGGAGAARNNALQYVTGKYLSILDADDFFELNMLETAYKKAEETDADVVVFHCDNFNTETKEYYPCTYSIRENLLPETQPFAGTDIPRDAFRLFVGWAWDKLFRTEYVKENGFYFQEQRTTNDLLFVFSAIIKAKRIVTMDDLLAHHRRGTESLSVTREKSWHCFYDALIALRNDLKKWGLYTRFEDDFINYSAGFSLWHLDTLAMPTKTLLFNKLHSEWLAELGVAGYPVEKYYDKQEFYKCDKILRHRVIDEKDGHIKVSVVLPSLNVAPFIRECIESAINQTMREIEIICVDAGSTDGTLEILEEYAQKDSRIKILHSPVKSYGYQMNMGMDAAQGEYFAILETDDYIKPLMFEELYQLAEDNYLDIIKPDFSIFVEDEEKWRYFEYRPMIMDRTYVQYGRVYTPKDYPYVFRCNNVIWSGIYDLTFLRSNHIRFHESPGASYQDNGFWFLTMCHANRLMYFERDYYMLRRDNPDSSIHSRGKVFSICDEYSYIREELHKEPEMEECFAALLALYRFKNYEWNYGRIGDEYKDIFVERFSEDFKKAMADGEIHGELFNMEESFRLRMILSDPMAYKYHRLAVENREKISFRREYSSTPPKTLERLNHELGCVYNSISFRIGRGLTWLPRKIRDCIKSFIRWGAGIRRHNNEQEPVGLEERRDYNFYCNLDRDYYRTELQRWYRDRTGKVLSLDFPQTFNEKIQWLKLYDSTPLKTALSDKYLVRKYVAEKIGESYLVPLLGVWSKFDDIDFGKLPEKFVLKTNHGCATNIIVTSKQQLDICSAKQSMEKWLSTNYAFKNGFELQYMNITPKIIAEEYLENAGGDLKDYKVFCFNGKADCIMYLSDRKKGLRMAFFDLNWNKLDFTYSYPRIEEPIPCPPNLQKMVELAERLAAGFAHVRVDFYVLNDGSIKFGEMTFTSASGDCNWSDEQANQRFGDLIMLPIKSPIPKYNGYDSIKKNIIARGR